MLQHLTLDWSLFKKQLNINRTAQCFCMASHPTLSFCMVNGAKCFEAFTISLNHSLYSLQSTKKKKSYQSQNTQEDVKDECY